MASAYSLDLRERALALEASGMHVDLVCSLLKIGRSSLYLWKKRKREEGSAAARKDWRKGHSPRVTDVEAFKAFVDKHQGKTAAEMAKLWGMAAQTMCRWLKKIGYTRKKRVLVTRSGMKASAQYIWSR